MKQLLILPMLILPFAAAHALCENERNNGTTISIDQCYDKEAKKSDQKILNVYNTYKKTLNADEQKRFLDLQRSWISYKMKQCDFEISSYGRGTIAGQLHTQCMINLNNRRIAEIQYMQNCGMESSSKFCSNYRPA